MTTGPFTLGSPPAPLLVLPSDDGPRVVVVVSGEADLSTAALLRDGLVGAVTRGPRSLVVDARELSFCDLAGLDALRDAQQVAERSGVVVTVRPSPQLRWLMATVEHAAPAGTSARAPAGTSARRTA